jgi:biotin carboxyl carrier protein
LDEESVLSRERKLRLAGGDGLHAVRLEPLENGYRIENVGTIVRSSDSPIWSVVTDEGRSFEALVETGESEIEVSIGPARFRFSSGAVASKVSRRGAASGRIEVNSPMPGRVVKVLVSAGQTVSAGQPVLLFEAMKMQNELRSPGDGVISEIAVTAGQAIEARERLYVLSSAP